MYAVGYTTWAKDTQLCTPIRFNDDNYPHLQRLPMIELMAQLADVFNKPSDSMWIVPGTHEDDPSFGRTRQVGLESIWELAA